MNFTKLTKVCFVVAAAAMLISMLIAMICGDYKTTAVIGVIMSLIILLVSSEIHVNKIVDAWRENNERNHKIYKEILDHAKDVLENSDRLYSKIRMYETLIDDLVESKEELKGKDIKNDEP